MRRWCVPRSRPDGKRTGRSILGLPCRRRILGSVAFDVGAQPADEQLHQVKAERRVLEVQLLDRALVDFEHVAGGDARRGVGAPVAWREEGNLAEDAARLELLADVA